MRIDQGGGVNSTDTNRKTEPQDFQKEFKGHQVKSAQGAKTEELTRHGDNVSDKPKLT